ncbi:PREDICTED: suppressor of IKBKE 1 isoform X3 [Crocodylus porosus]|uniref:suppressor of IKBKE 1 isoform X3 n=1 Tax=Crocodylus porosus TaxID=8502 RepID=UPI00093B7FF8|nr:PREDICTED: suppressor of IKBKE 1 isoform X3 [Crocodylus porosus]
MSCTIEKILTDARTLLDRLRDHDSAAESLIDQSAALHRRVAAMRQAGAAGAKQAHDEAANVKDASKLKPHLLLSQENTQIRDLQRENRELWISLEEHQDALELIMSKYRKQMLQLTRGRKDEDAEPVLKVHQAQSVEIESQIDRIYEMGEVMRKAVQVDDDQFFTIQEKLAQLEEGGAWLLKNPPVFTVPELQVPNKMLQTRCFSSCSGLFPQEVLRTGLVSSQLSL